MNISPLSGAAVSPPVLGFASEIARIVGHARAVFIVSRERAATWADRASARLRLVSLDDRMLDDIGVDRAQALLEAAKPFWRA